MAVGRVWVFPGILPANIKVAPNSPNARARLKILPDIKDLEAKGIDIKKKMFQHDKFIIARVDHITILKLPQ